MRGFARRVEIPRAQSGKDGGKDGGKNGLMKSWPLDIKKRITLFLILRRKGIYHPRRSDTMVARSSAICADRCATNCFS